MRDSWCCGAGGAFWATVAVCHVRLLCGIACDLVRFGLMVQ